MGNGLTYKEEFIKFMVNGGILRFGEFTLKSGRLSPYFINTGNYKSGSQISKLGEFYAECIMDNNIKGDAIFGPAYKGIPLAIATGIILNNKFGVDMNYCFDRKEVKDHGEGGMIIGYQFGENDKKSRVSVTQMLRIWLFLLIEWKSVRVARSLPFKKWKKNLVSKFTL